MSRKEESRERIISSAGALLREKGVAGTSVSEVMGGAGMTVGGFYAHFPSKEALVSETVSTAMCESRDGLKAAAGSRTGSEWLKSVTRSYLSRAHRDNPSVGCPLPASAGEIANADESVRRALAVEVDSIADEMGSHIEEAGLDDPRTESLAVLALMVGGLTLARATRDTELSDEILLACRKHAERCLE